MRIRAEALLAANEINPGGMASVYFGHASRVIDACRSAKNWCIENGHPNADCSISERMTPKSVYISGTNEALDYMDQNYREFGIHGIRRVKDSLPLHCRLMKPAVGPFAEALEQMSIEKPIIKVHSNYDAKPYMSSAHIRRNLSRQLYNPIKWEQTIHEIFARSGERRFPTTYTMGPGCAHRQNLKTLNVPAWRRSTNVGDVSEHTRNQYIRKQDGMKDMLKNYKHEISDCAYGGLAYLDGT